MKDALATLLLLAAAALVVWWLAGGGQQRYCPQPVHLEGYTVACDGRMPSPDSSRRP